MPRPYIIPARFPALAGMLVAIVLTLCLAVAGARPASAIEIREVRSPGGIVAWLVEDYSVPIIAVSMEFTGGSNLDPEGREGMAAILSAMMDEGAGDLSASDLKAEMEDRAIEMGFPVSRDSMSARLVTLRSEADRAFELMSLVLSDPAMEPQALERVRAGALASVDRREKSPGALMRSALRENLFPVHPYGRDDDGSRESLSAITREELQAHHRLLFARDKVHVGVVGAISEEELARRLDQMLMNLPEAQQAAPIADVAPRMGIVERIEFNSPQTEISVVWPGYKRDHPQFFTAHLVTHILGGGTFSSRLYNEIREERGLAYSVGASLVTSDHSAYVAAGLATRPDQAEDALGLLLAEARRMAEEGPSEEELETARRNVLGSYVIRNFTSSGRIASLLVGLQSAGLGRDYLDTRREEINAVTLEQARAVARDLFSADPAIVMVGPQVPSR